jgi:hypothetical protein
MTKNWKKNYSCKKKLTFFLSKTAIYLSLALHKVCPSYNTVKAVFSLLGPGHCTVQKLFSQILCLHKLLHIGRILSPYRGQKILTLNLSQSYAVFEVMCFTFYSVQKFFIPNIDLHAIAGFDAWSCRK